MSQWKWVVIDDSGNIIKGWYKDKDNNKWYHLDETTGGMNTGWFKNKDERWYYLDEKNGEMKTGWIQLKGIWYYLQTRSNGYMGAMYFSSTHTIDGKSYTFDSSGRWINNLVSDKCINFVKSYEGFSATRYDDGTGVITQGYGCTGEEIADWDEKVTEEFATERLKYLINNKYAAVIKFDLDSKGLTLKQNEFDAIISLSYNIGTNGLLGSTLYKRICEGVRDSSLKDNFTVWSKAGNRTLQGLLNRRVEEYNMFANGDYNRDL